MKAFEGVITANKMQKTVVVEVSRRLEHPLYKKILRRSKKYKADTGSFEVAFGDKVKIAQTRPLSKGKYFKVVEIIGKGSVIAIPEIIVEAKKENVAEKTGSPVKKVRRVKKTEVQVEENKK
ncbi:MAG: 30S ribosomal protein S17 [Candidatus Levybacteria bacterium]|nr:30S ribosomal protein S17 [Candidatus Levybacteria bacterium]